MKFTDSAGNVHILPEGKTVYKRISVYPVVLNEKGQLLMYMPHFNPQWQFPGGGMEDEIDQSAQKAAERECLEETGFSIRVSEKQPFYKGKQNFYKRGDGKFYFSEHLFFYGELLSDKRVEVSDEDKEATVSWVNLSDLNEENTHFIIHPVIKLLKEKYS